VALCASAPAEARARGGRDESRAERKTSKVRLSDMRSDPTTRGAAKKAHIVLVGVGGADLGAGDRLEGGTCKGAACYAADLRAFGRPRHDGSSCSRAAELEPGRAARDQVAERRSRREGRRRRPPRKRFSRLPEQHLEAVHLQGLSSARPQVLLVMRRMGRERRSWLPARRGLPALAYPATVRRRLSEEANDGMAASGFRSIKRSARRPRSCAGALRCFHSQVVMHG
jgi:hypothetical protein